MNDSKPKSKREKKSEKQVFCRFMNIFGKIWMFVRLRDGYSLECEFPCSHEIKDLQCKKFEHWICPSLQTMKNVILLFFIIAVNFIRGLLYANFKKRWERSTISNVDRRLKSIHKLIIFATEKTPNWALSVPNIHWPCKGVYQCTLHSAEHWKRKEIRLKIKENSVDSKKKKE